MVPKLHAKGSSFKGAAAYLLHDKDRATSSERVAWTETRNIVSPDPQVAWRVMAATSMSQAALKNAAGIKATGRKSKNHVQHLTLSWKDHEADGLTREEMIRAADSALEVLGARDHQALYVCHDDEPHPHVHILINRVSPDDGRLLSSSKEKLSLSRWAQGYEEERGKILCEQRVKNNAARDAGEYVRGKKDRPRHIYELEVSNDNRADADKIRKEQRAKDYALAETGRALHLRQRRERAALESGFRERNAAIKEKAKQEIAAARAKVRADFEPRFEALQDEQRAQLAQFRAREETVFGRIRNALDGFNRVARTKEAVGGSLREAFRMLAGSAGRVLGLERQQEAARRALHGRQTAAEARALSPIRRKLSEDLSGGRETYLDAHAELAEKLGAERREHQGAWRERNRERREVWHSPPPRKAPASESRAENLKSAFDRAYEARNQTRAESTPDDADELLRDTAKKLRTDQKHPDRDDADLER